MKARKYKEEKPRNDFKFMLFDKSRSVVEFLYRHGCLYYRIGDGLRVVNVPEYGEWYWAYIDEILLDIEIPE